MKIDVSKITPRQELIIAKGLCDYQYIMENWKKDDSDFRAVYYDFYLKASWAVMSKENNSQPYFEKLQSENLNDDLMAILADLKGRMESKRYEFSLVTKLLHTRNPKLPIYDSKVREYLSREKKVNLWWQIPNKESGAKRGTTEEKKIEHDWDLLREWYADFLESERGKEWIDWFDDNFPTYKNISPVKKIDFIIFATN